MLTWNLYSKAALRRERLTRKSNPRLYFGEVKGADLLHLQSVWFDIMGIPGERNVLARYTYNDVDVVATIDAFSEDFGLHIIRFTRRPLWRFSGEILNFTAYVYLRSSGRQADYGCIYAIDPSRPQKFERRVIDITPESFADTEQRLYNLTDKYKMLFLEK